MGNRRAKGMCVLWAMGVTQHNQGSDVDRHLQSAFSTGKLQADGKPGHIRCAVITWCRERSDHGSMPNNLRDYQVGG